MRQFSIFLCMVLVFSACSKKPRYPAAPFDGNRIRVALADVPEEKPVFFTFFSNARGINYFLIRKGGNIEAYFDACGKCYPQKMGFRLEGSRVVCRKCDVSYHLDDLKDGIGSCYPIKLSGRIEGSSFVIDRQDILKGEKYF